MFLRSLAAAASAEDCNWNWVDDVEDIAQGTSQDCNGNAVPDECDSRPEPFTSSSGWIMPVGASTPKSFTIPSARLSQGDVKLTLAISADLAGEDKSIAVSLRGFGPVGTVLGSAPACPLIPAVTEIVVPRWSYNYAVSTGEVTFDLVPSDSVDGSACGGNSYMSASVSYDVAALPDCNGNGRLDECDVLSGTSADVNTDGRPDECESVQQFGCITFATRSANPYGPAQGANPGAPPYPVGTTGAGTGTLNLPGGSDQRIWVELWISNWACSGHQMGTWQAQYGPDGALPAGITRPHQPCDETPDYCVGPGNPRPCCRGGGGCCSACDCEDAGMGPGDGAGCGLGIPGECDPNFEQDPPNQPTALGFDIEACMSPNLACGGTQVATPPVADDGIAHYAMTVVLEVDAAFTGCADINVLGLGADTFFQDENGAQVPIGKATPLTVCVETGSCCNLDGSCTEDTTQGACGFGPPRFRPGTSCPINGGPSCFDCITNGDCQGRPNDLAGACTTSRCVNSFCEHTPIQGYVPGGPNCCHPLTAAQAPRADDDPCTTDACNVDDALSLGTPAHTPAPKGTDCDDDNLCTADDACADGVCNGTNVNGQPCLTDADCRHSGETASAVCDGGECLCPPQTDLNFVIDPGSSSDPNCFSVGEKISVSIHVGPAAEIINGGQFAISYDPACLDFVSIGPAGPPYVNEVQEIVDENAGTIFYAVGVELGGEGVAGNSDMAIITFIKLGDCSACNLCFTDDNPMHTYLVDDEGQPVLVAEKCSKEIRQTPSLIIEAPDNRKVNVGCNSATGRVTWDPPSVISDCEDIELVCTGEHKESGCLAGHCCGGANNGDPCTTDTQCPLGNCFPSAMTGGDFPVGTTVFCCLANNSCGFGGAACWHVTVNDETSLDVEIQLSPTMVTKPGGGIIRCIEFEVFSNCVQAPLTFCEDAVFGGLFYLAGHFIGPYFKIPSQIQPACITARDKLHTLRSCYVFADEDCDHEGILHATFKGDPFFGGNWLIGGNLDGWKKDNPAASHDVIDILDFGQIVAEWLTDYGTGDTPCPEDCHPDEANADINGDGVVDLLDYSFVAMNFLEDSKDCCCPGSASLGNTRGRTEISVPELVRGDLKELIVADLNNDGVVNLQDMAALMQGVRPTRQAPDRENGKGTSAPGRSTGR